MKSLSAHTEFGKTEKAEKKRVKETHSREKKGVERKKFLDRTSLANSFLSRLSTHCGLLLWEQPKIAYGSDNNGVCGCELCEF